jgi:methylphosphotriester-DNA--protein-cysteine methyltransferase/quercetin dioxygenase-like cupin family protein
MIEPVERAAILQHFPMASRARGQVWRHQPAFHRPRHFHPQLELNFVSRGEARLSVGREVVNLRAGALLWFLPGQSHELVAASPELELWVVGLTQDFAEVLGAPDACHRALGPTAPGELYQRCRATLEGTYDAASEPAMAALVRAAVDAAGAARAIHVDPLVARALRQLGKNPPSSRSSLARQLHVSEGELSRRFHAEIGVPYRAYRHRLRVMRCIEYLDRGEPGVMRAAIAAGFGSYSQCFRVFEQVVGHSPSSYLEVGRESLDSMVQDPSRNGDDREATSIRTDPP